MMNLFKHVTRQAVALFALLTLNLNTYAAEVVYRIVEYNKTTGEYILAASGQVPQYSWAYFENDFGATTGNRYNQIPRNRKATLYLEGWKGCTIKNITFSMCSNNKAGQVGFSVCDEETALYTMRPTEFADDAWFGQWVSKDLGVYVDVTQPVKATAFTTDVSSIVIQGGKKEGSVYINAITIDYDEATGMTLESPLGWTYEKLEKKSTLNDGDEVMIFRNGCAASDIDGIETSHYLDATPLSSTTDVTNPYVLCFTLNKVKGESLWTMKNQYGRILGATGKQALAWNEGSTRWSINLGYDGATITNENPTYGTIRYNTPVESYARFNVYTSTSLPLPFLYRKVKQLSPVCSQSIVFDKSEMTVIIAEGHIALKPTLSPAKTTDKRMIWTSSNESVANVNGGFVTLSAPGITTITAKTKDGGAEASLTLTVTEATNISSIVNKVSSKQPVRKILNGHRVVIVNPKGQYEMNGLRL